MSKKHGRIPTQRACVNIIQYGIVTSWLFKEMNVKCICREKYSFTFSLYEFGLKRTAIPLYPKISDNACHMFRLYRLAGGLKVLPVTYVGFIPNIRDINKRTNRGILAVISGTNIPWSVNSVVYLARITSNEPCLIRVIWSSWINSQKPTQTIYLNFLYTGYKTKSVEPVWSFCSIWHSFNLPIGLYILYHWIKTRQVIPDVKRPWQKSLFRILSTTHKGVLTRSRKLIANDKAIYVLSSAPSVGLREPWNSRKVLEMKTRKMSCKAYAYQNKANKTCSRLLLHVSVSISDAGSSLKRILS